MVVLAPLVRKVLPVLPVPLVRKALPVLPVPLVPKALPVLLVRLVRKVCPDSGVSAVCAARWQSILFLPAACRPVRHSRDREVMLAKAGWPCSRAV